MANKKERTFVMVKPDGVQRTLVGDIIKRFERTGLKLVALKLTLLSEETLWKHYDKDDTWFESKGANIIVDREKAGVPVEKDALYAKASAAGMVLRHFLNARHQFLMYL